MKVIKIIIGFVILFYHLLAPVALWGIVGTFIWGPEVIYGPGKEHPSMIYSMILVPPIMLMSAWHYVFNDLVPNVLIHIPKGKKEDPKSIEMIKQWVQKSKAIAQKKVDALEEYEIKLAEES